MTTASEHADALAAKALAIIDRRLKDQPSASLWLKKGELERQMGQLGRAARAYSEASLLEASSRTTYLRNLLSPTVETGLDFSVIEDPVPAPCLRYVDFLASHDEARIWSFIAENVESMKRSKIKNRTNTDIRDSRYLIGQEIQALDWFRGLVQPVIDRAYEAFHIPASPGGRLSMQLTSHGDAEYYKVHRDANPKATFRKISYIYYLHQEPKKFTGGELKLYDTNLTPQTCAETFTRIEPVNNSLVIFPSHFFHEVCPVRLDSKNRLEGRWTLNGWHGENKEPFT